MDCPKKITTIYGADGTSIYKSIDAGVSWTNVTGSSQIIPYYVAADPSNSGVVYAYANRVIKSTDGGSTWQSLNASGYLGNVKQLAVDPAKPTTLYASAFGAFPLSAFVRSTDGGVTWSPTKGIIYQDVHFSQAPSRLSTFYAVDNCCAYRSDDGGATFKQLSGNPEYVAPIAVDPFDPDTAYAWRWNGSQAGGSFVGAELHQWTTVQALWKLIDLALSGEAADAGFGYATAFAVAPTQPGRIYFAASPGWDVFVAKIDPTGSKLLYSTYLGGISNDYGNAIALGPDGSIYVAGSTASNNFPVTAGAVQKVFGGGSSFRDPRSGIIDITDYPRGTDAFAARISADGGSLVYSTYLGGTQVDWALGMAVDATGNAFVAGYSFCTDFPQTNTGISNPQIFKFSSFLAEVFADGSRLSMSTCFGGNAGSAASSVATDSDGRVFFTGSAGSTAIAATPGTIGGSLPVFALQFPETTAITGFSDAVAFTSAASSAGSIAAVFGSNLSSTAMQATAIPLPLSLNGVAVTVDGVAAPLYYAGSGQINFQVPWQTKIGTPSIVVTNDHGLSAASTLRVNSASPVIATNLSTNHVVGFNQDGSLNSQANPASPGSVMTIYLIGQGPVKNQPAPGAASPLLPLATAAFSSSVKVGTATGQVQFLGLTPGSVGLAQANIQLPLLPSGDYPLVLTVGGAASNSVVVSIGAN